LLIMPRLILTIREAANPLPIDGSPPLSVILEMPWRFLFRSDEPSYEALSRLRPDSMVPLRRNRM
jgi:hypothetical protein